MLHIFANNWFCPTSKCSPNWPLWFWFTLLCSLTSLYHSCFIFCEILVHIFLPFKHFASGLFLLTHAHMYTHTHTHSLIHSLTHSLMYHEYSFWILILCELYLWKISSTLTSHFTHGIFGQTEFLEFTEFFYNFLPFL